MPVQAGKVQVTAIAAGKIRHYRIALFTAGRKTMQVYNAIGCFAVQGILPHNAGIIIRLQVMPAFTEGNVAG